MPTVCPLLPLSLCDFLTFVFLRQAEKPIRVISLAAIYSIGRNGCPTNANSRPQKLGRQTLNDDLTLADTGRLAWCVMPLMIQKSCTFTENSLLTHGRIRWIGISTIMNFVRGWNNSPTWSRAFDMLTNRNLLDLKEIWKQICSHRYTDSGHFLPMKFASSYSMHTSYN